MLLKSMTASTEIEERWIQAWNDLFDLVGKRLQVDCLLPDRSVVDIETCQGWLEDSAYEDYYLKVAEAWVKGKRGIAVARFKKGDRDLNSKNQP
jgi:hypothetical protein